MIIKNLEFISLTFKLYLISLVFIENNIFSARSIIFNTGSSATYPYLWPSDDTFSASTSLIENNFLSATHRAIFDTTSVVLDGGGYSLVFPSITTTPTLVINSSCAITTTNIFMQNIHSSLISIASGGSLTFGSNTTLHLNQSQALSTTWTFSGNTLLKGENNLVNVASGIISVLSGGTLKITNLILQGVASSSFSLQDNTAALIFENTTLQIPTLCNLSTGSFLVRGNVEINGGGIFAYSGNISSSVDTGSNLLITNNSTLRYSPSIANQNLFYLTDKTSKISLINSTLDVTTTGIRLSKGTFYIDGGSNITSAATVPAQGVYFGDGISSGNDLDVDIQPGAPLNLSTGYLIYNNIGG